MCLKPCGGASRCLRMVVGVDGMFHAFLLPPTSSVRFGKSKLSPIFLALLDLSSS